MKSNLSAAAVVAVLLILVGIWGLNLLSYPAPEITGNYTFTEGAGGRGSVIVTEKEPAEITLGGYCEVRVAPESVIKLEGSRQAEQVYLEKGEIACEIEPQTGKFTVRTEVGQVKVTGTEFIVRLLDDPINGQNNNVTEEGAEMFTKRMFVKVLAGAVLLSGSWGEAALAAGEEAVVPGQENVAMQEAKAFPITINEKVAAIDIGISTLEDVIRVFGEPIAYLWGQETFTKENLPEIYIAKYPDGLNVEMFKGTVGELRFSSPAAGYVFRDEIEVGSLLEEVLEVIGQPDRTITGSENKFEEGILYKDINGEEGYCYYSRKEQGVRMFFVNNLVKAIYLTGNQPVGISNDDKAETEAAEIF